MPEAAFNRIHRPNRLAIATVVLMHGTAITALGLSKMEVMENPFKKRTTVINIPSPPPPPPPPKTQESEQPRAKSQHVSVITAPKPVVLPPIHFNPAPALDPQPQPRIEPSTPPGPVEILPPPPLRPAPKTIEPARARANLASYVSDGDYPAGALRAEQQGTTRFRLTVGADGRVSGCTVTNSSGSSSLDAATCRIMKSRARFTPARDSGGAATGDTVSSAIRWVLPD